MYVFEAITISDTYFFFFTFYFGIILDFWKSCKQSTEFLYIIYPPSRNVNILCNHSTFVETKKLTLVRCY